MREQIANPIAGLTILPKGKSGFDQIAIEFAWFIKPATGGDRLAVVRRQFGFGVKSVDVAYPARGVDKDYLIGLGGKVAPFGE